MKSSGSIPWAKPDFWGDEEALLVDALRSSWISGGPYVERLESEVSHLTGMPHCLAVSNGTTALHLAYLGLELKPGDEVIVPGFAFLAAANVALHMGARPVFAEVSPDSWCVTAESLESVVTSRTRAIVAVHTYGNVCPMDEILDLARERALPVIEDAAESFSSTYREKQSGSLGTIGVLSFQATKTITTGEGGMVLTRDEDLKSRMTLYRSHGMAAKRYWHVVAGHNFRLTNIQASLGCAQLRRLPQIIAQRRRVHSTYLRLLGNARGLRLQRFEEKVNPVLWAMAVRLDEAAFPIGRDGVMRALAESGIETRPGFYASSEQPLYERHSLPVCEAVSRSMISLPTFPSLEDDQIERVCSELLALRRKNY